MSIHLMTSRLPNAAGQMKGNVFIALISPNLLHLHSHLLNSCTVFVHRTSRISGKMSSAIVTGATGEAPT